MELFIDAFDWVMVPNVYALSQKADGGQITTKSYISSSNYILRMSDYKRDDWCNIWDGVYWRFIHKHREILRRNPRMNLIMVQLRRMNEEELGKHISTAEDFLLG